jgi:phosphoribosylanthranilate isomerase
VKMCGITDIDTARYAVEIGVDAIGFVFAPSKRRITRQAAKEIIEQLPLTVEKIGVFVNERSETIEEIAAYCGLTVIQLHGDEGNDMCTKLSLPVIKAVGIGCVEDIEEALLYDVDCLLVDSPKGEKFYGGNGESFNWSLLKGKEIEGKHLILAGGLHADNVREAINTVQPFMVDVSSGVETNGKKDLKKMKEFMTAIKEVGSK